jgi:hypothetical protein
VHVCLCLAINQSIIIGSGKKKERCQDTVECIIKIYTQLKQLYTNLAKHYVQYKNIRKGFILEVFVGKSTQQALPDLTTYKAWIAT